MKKVYGVCFILSGLLVMPVIGFAQGQDAIARAQYMLRQVNAEKNALQQENIRLKKELEALKSDMQVKLTKSEKGNKKLSGKVKSLQQRNQQFADVLSELRQQYNELQLKNSGNENMLGQYSENLQLCVNNNKELYQVNLELLNSYQKKGVWASIKKAEPFTRLKKVQIENMAQEYQYRIEDLQVEPIAQAGEEGVSMH